MLNGRSHSDNFTCISSKGRSVVDYCIVQADYFQSISNFTVRTISEFLDNIGIVDAEQLPDHSLLSWLLEISVPLCASTIEEKESGKVHVLITEEYLADKEDELNAVTKDINGLASNDGQEAQDQVYDNLVTTLRDAGVQRDRMSKKKRRLRKVTHGGTESYGKGRRISERLKDYGCNAGTKRSQGD